MIKKFVFTIIKRREVDEMRTEKEIKLEILRSKNLIREYEENILEANNKEQIHTAKLYEVRIIKEKNKIAVLEWVLGNEKNKK